MDKNAASGEAPMAARSLRPLARQRCPTASAGCQSRRKWTCSSVRSVVTTTSVPAFGCRMAQSSPMPSRRVFAEARLVARFRIAEMSESSPGLFAGRFQLVDLSLARMV